MKKRLNIVLIALMAWVGMSAQGFYVGLEGSRVFENKNNTSYPNWELGAFASYSRTLYQRLGFDVQAGLYTQYYEDGSSFKEYIADPDAPQVSARNHHGVTFGGKLAASLSLKIVGPVSVFTGPVLGCNFFQKDYYGSDADDFGLHRAQLQWRLGAIADVRRLRLRLSWEHDLTRREPHNDCKQEGVTLSVAYRL